MNEQEILLLVIDRLGSLQVPYMLTGSVAVSYYRVPRATHDIDFVVAIQQSEVKKIQQTFEPEFYISDIEQAIRYHQMFNMIHHLTQIKIACWIHDVSNEFRAAAFEKKIQRELFGKSVFIIRKEDLIVSKLLWYNEAESDIHLRDIEGILKIQKGKIDLAYIQQWCNKLALTKHWNKIKA
jgi:hypothetical protein